VVSQVILLVYGLVVIYVRPLVREVGLHLRIRELVKGALPEYRAVRLRRGVADGCVIFLSELAVHAEEGGLGVRICGIARERGYNVPYEVIAYVYVALPVGNGLEPVGYRGCLLVPRRILGHERYRLARRNIIRIGEEREIHVILEEIALVAGEEI